MADLLGTGVSGLLAFQSALTTTGHNISNVNTPGYSRQRVELVTRIPQPTGAGYIGSGVNVISVERLFDQFTIDQLRMHTSLNSQLQTYHGLASQVDNLLADPNAGLAPTLQNFFNAMQGLADNPSSIPARQVLLSESESLVERFKSIDARLSSLRDSVNAKLELLVSEVNSYADSIARLNKDIRLARDMAGGQEPNDLLDQRDELVRQLAEKVPVTTVEQDDGAINVFIGNGQTLVLGDRTQRIGITRNPYDAYRYEIAVGQDGSGPNISDYLQGGEIGGVLAFRTAVLEPTQNELGRIALALAKSINDQHAQGLDLNNLLGGDFFADVGLGSNDKLAIGNVANTSGANVLFAVDDVTRLTSSDYVLETKDGTHFSLVRKSDNRVVDAFTAGGYPLTYTSVSEGVSLTIDGAPNAGDSWMLQPTRSAARDLRLVITNVKSIAAAGPLRSSGSAANLGDGTITPPETLDITDVNFFSAIDIEIGTSNPAAVPPPADLYSIDGGATWNAFTPGADIDINGWRVRITGTPQVGDTFTVEKNDNAVGDNRNALALAQLQNLGVLDGSTNSLQAAYAQMVSGVGARTHQLEINSQAQNTILQQAQQTREAISGVNLDEEAANLVKFQQAYQATAQLINAANTLFDALLNAVR